MYKKWSRKDLSGLPARPSHSQWFADQTSPRTLVGSASHSCSFLQTRGWSEDCRMVHARPEKRCKQCHTKVIVAEHNTIFSFAPEWNEITECARNDAHLLSCVQVRLILRQLV